MFGEIRNVHGERLDYSFHPSSEGSRDLLLIAHGVTGNKDRPFALALAEAASVGGLAALRLSFSGNGESEGEFGASCVSKEVEDLGAVLDVLEGYRVAYAGHSMGAAVGVLRAASDQRIRFLVSLAGMVETAQFAQRKFGQLTPGRDFMWEKPDCPLSQRYMDDMRGIGSVVDGARSIRVPWLLVHGTQDSVVPLQDSLAILERANEPVELIQIEGADHVFSDTYAEEMATLVMRWLAPRLAT